eukprot:1012886-Amorphochlora_amoeboformis.AAC.1
MDRNDMYPSNNKKTCATSTSPSFACINIPPFVWRLRSCEAWSLPPDLRTLVAGRSAIGKNDTVHVSTLWSIEGIS